MNPVVENLDALVGALDGLNVAVMSGAEVVDYVRVWRDAHNSGIARTRVRTRAQIQGDIDRRRDSPGNVVPLKTLAEQIIDAGRRRRGEIE